MLKNTYKHNPDLKGTKKKSLIYNSNMHTDSKDPNKMSQLSLEELSQFYNHSYEKQLTTPLNDNIPIEEKFTQGGKSFGFFSWFEVPENFGLARYRFGKIRSDTNPGWKLAFHFGGYISSNAIVYLGSRCEALPKVHANTTDKINLEIDSVLHYKVTDPAKIMKENQYRSILFNLAQSHINNAISKISLDDFFSDRSSLLDNLWNSENNNMNQRIEHLGIQISLLQATRAHMKSEDLQKAFAQGAIAEQTKQKLIKEGEGIKSKTNSQIEGIIEAIQPLIGGNPEIVQKILDITKSMTVSYDAKDHNNSIIFDLTSSQNQPQANALLLANLIKLNQEK